jgi:predicted nuclease of predicted toxin-antitoxin system
MSWRNNLRATIDATDNNWKGHDVSYSRVQSSKDPSTEILSLVEKIGDRDAVVDACLPPQLANDLRRNSVNAIWVPAILGDGASDEEIERQLLTSGLDWWGSSKKEKVLLTRDVEFYKRIRSKAILVSYRVSNLSARGMISNAALRSELKRMVRFQNPWPDDN